MFIVLDVQGFMISGQTFSPKELAIFDGQTISHYIFKAPFPFSTLPPDLQTQAKWLINNHHGIPWNEGYTPCFLFPTILERLLKDADVVYVKGREKRNFLRRYTKKPIIEIEEYPALSATQPSCMYHSKVPCYCALSNVYHLYKHYVME